MNIFKTATTRLRLIKTLVTCGSLMCFSFPTLAANPDIDINHSTFKIAQLLKQQLAQPENAYQLALQKHVLMDTQQVTLYRYQKDPTSINFNQSHVSMVIDAAGKLKGIARMDPDLARKDQVSTAQAEAIARAFLDQYAPDLIENLDLQWIKPHDEKININTREQVTLTGMKVKCRDRSTGLYFWVIIAPDKSVIVFERDIHWNFAFGGRQTEKWLHDTWLSKHK